MLLSVQHIVVSFIYKPLKTLPLLGSFLKCIQWGQLHYPVSLAD